MILGTISAVDNTDGLQLIIDGEEVATTKKYSYIASYVPAAEDRVVVEEIGGSYVILGKIITDMASSGIARQAESATYATTAEACTGNAATATVAESCTGNAETATSAITAQYLAGAQTQYGGLVTNVQSQYVSDLGMSVVTAVNYSSGNYLKTGI